MGRLNFSVSFPGGGGDERRRNMRRDDPRRHTLGGDMLVYGGSQHPHAHQMAPQQQRAMDLEVSSAPRHLE